MQGLGLSALIVLALWGIYIGYTRSQQNTEEVYTYIPTTEGGLIPIPYSRPDMDEYVAEQLAPTREVPLSSGIIRVGSQAIVPKWEWVKVMNDSPVTQRFSNGARKLVKGDSCGIEFGNTIIVKEIRGESLLVEYHHTAPGEPMGTACPSGVQFLVSKTKFAKMSEQYAAIRDSIQAEKDLVKRLLRQDYYGPKEKSRRSYWIDVVNLKPVKQEYSNGYDYLAYGDNCIIDSDGTLQVRGETEDRVLYEYTARGRPLGTAAPSGVLFFEAKDH